MIHLAIEGNPDFSFSDVENRREKTSYSVETVDYVLEKYRLTDLELYFIVGQDAFHAIRTWKDWERLLLMCNFAVMTRPGYINHGLEANLGPEFASRFSYDESSKAYKGPTGHSIFFREVTFLDIASSNIRQRAKDGKGYTLPGPGRRPPLHREKFASTGTCRRHPERAHNLFFAKTGKWVPVPFSPIVSAPRRAPHEGAPERRGSARPGRHSQ